jgi:hypothetical protein
LVITSEKINKLSNKRWGWPDLELMKMMGNWLGNLLTST